MNFLSHWRSLNRCCKLGLDEMGQQRRPVALPIAQEQDSGILAKCSLPAYY